MESELSSHHSSFDLEMETRNEDYSLEEEMVQLSLQVKSQYYKVQKPPVPKKPKRIAPQPQPTTFHVGNMRKRAEYET